MGGTPDKYRGVTHLGRVWRLRRFYRPDRSHPTVIRCALLIDGMSSDIGRVLRMMNLVGDEGFVEALENAESLVEDAEDTLRRVEKIEGEAEAAVREANETLQAVDTRLMKFDETISRLEAKIEAAFSIAFLFFAVSQYTEGQVLIAGGLAIMGFLGFSSLVVTIVTLPQVQRLRQVGEYASDRLD